MNPIATRSPVSAESDFAARLEAFLQRHQAVVRPEIWEATTLPVRPLLASLGAAGILAACRSRAADNRKAGLWCSVELHRGLAGVGNGAPGGPVLTQVDVLLRLVDELRGLGGLGDALAAGTTVAALAATEPNAGSDLTQLQTRVHRHAGSLVVTGEKCYVSNAPYADHFLVLADDSEHATGAGSGPALLLVPQGAGVVVRPITTAGHPGLLGRVVLDRAAVALVALPAGRALLMLIRHWIHERVMLGVRMAALAEQVLARAVADTRAASTFGVPLVTNQHVQFTLARLTAAVHEVHALTNQGVRLLAAGRCPAPYAATCKHRASQVLRRVTDEALQLAGGAGYQTGHPAERAWRDSAGLALAGGTDELMLMQIDRETRS